MNAVAKLLSIIGVTALLSSCSPPQIDIAVERIHGRMLLRLSQDWGIIFSDRQVPCVREVGLHVSQNDDRSKAAWLIEAKGAAQCLDLASVTVGEVPTGWQEVVRLSTNGGRVYTIRARGIGWGETSAKF